jgi:hypothetical protein
MRIGCDVVFVIVCGETTEDERHGGHVLDAVIIVQRGYGQRLVNDANCGLVW